MPDLRQARKLNYYYSKTLTDWDVAVDKLLETNVLSQHPFDNFFSKKFIDEIKAYQSSLSIKQDGIIGPKMVKMITGCTEYNMVGQKCFIHKTNMKYTDIEIVNWSTSGYDFNKYHNMYNMRTRNIKAIILHWDVCKNSKSCYNILLERKLSIHFMVDCDGTIYQCLDTELKAFHAKSANGMTIGIEINNPYYKLDAPSRILIKEPEANASHNNNVEHIAFSDDQISSVCSLCKNLCSVLDIPLNLPGGSDDNPMTHYISGVSRMNHLNKRSEFSGVAGHYHYDSNKIDPGGSLWEPLKSVGFQVVKS